MPKKVFILILVDQITKLVFWNRDFFLSVIHFHSVRNYGLGFSLNFGLLNNLILLGAAVLFFIYYYIRHELKMTVLGRWAFVLVIAGAISNIGDRLYLGYVRDFIDVGLHFTFNLADVFIILGLILVLFSRETKTDEPFFRL